MKHSFKFIYLIVIIVVIAIIVTLGLFVMKSSQEFTSSTDLSLTDTNEFNNIWLSYKGKQQGSMIKRMIQKVISNAEENENNPSMLIDIAYKMHANDEFTVINSTKKLNNVEQMKNILSEIDGKHYYIVEFVYAKSKQISGIIIKYSQNDKFEDFIPDEH